MERLAIYIDVGFLDFIHHANIDLKNGIVMLLCWVLLFLWSTILETLYHSAADPMAF